MTDPFRSRDVDRDLAGELRDIGERVVDLFFERTEPAPPPPTIEPKRTRLRPGRRVGFVSLVAGCGTTTLAALVAQRSGGGGARVALVDLDPVAPSLALLAGARGPTVADALVATGVRGRRWGSADVLFAPPAEIGALDPERAAALVARLAAEAAVVVDAGALGAPGTERILRACDAVLYVGTPRGAHVHAATRALPLLAALAVPARLILCRAAPEVGASVAREIGLPLAGTVPEDPFLARDEFRIRAETARAVDALCVALAA